MIEEKDLILQSQQGDKEAFCALMEAHQSRIYALCYKYMQNTHDASDAAQEAILKIYLNISRFRFASAFSTWAYRIAVNACVDMLRKRKVTVPLEDFGAASSQGNPDADVLYAEFKAGLAKAVAGLPPKDKSMIVLREMEQKSYEEIAEILGVPVGTVKSRLARAREKLKKTLQLHHLL
jgi:RNA polymerase sigma-70 factor, ECF subfamily